MPRSIRIMTVPITLLRNIGISAHVDAGKTTLTERILFYTGRIHRMGEVHDRDGRGATTDSLGAEKAHGITIRSAATSVDWRDHAITIIDTPGHADFAVEVERSLAVLDGAVFVFSAVEGVQAQSLAVDRQMRRHGVPRLAFINKMDRAGADAQRVVADIERRLEVRSALLQLPIGSEQDFEGVVDLLDRRALRFGGAHGEIVQVGPVPAGMAESVEAARDALVDIAAEFDESVLMDALDGNDIDAARLRAALRQATLGLRFVPALCGSAFRNKGVQPVLDAVVDYLPAPTDVTNVAFRTDGVSRNEVVLESSRDADVVAFVFKLDEGRFGQLSWVRLYQGLVARGDSLLDVRSGDRVRIGRLLRLHADRATEIESASAGEIVGLHGVRVESGDTLCAPGLHLEVAPLVVPTPVVTRTIVAVASSQGDAMVRALQRYAREDPSLRLQRDETTGDQLVSGVGTLQLDIYAERLADEHGIEVQLGTPHVAYRESIGQPTEFDHRHRKQPGGRGQYAHVIGTLEPLESTDAVLEFAFEVRGGAIPREFASACERGAKEALEEGPLVGAPVFGVRVRILDGSTHVKDSSDLAFRVATRDAVKAALQRAAPQLLEPVMAVSVDCPSDVQGSVQGSLMRRRGTVTDSEFKGGQASIEAELPLAESFDLAQELASVTGGRGTHSMALVRYTPVPEPITCQLVADEATG